MKTPAITTSVPKPIEKKLIDPDKLLQALYFAYDTFQRVNIPMFLVGKTAEQALKGHNLKDDKVEIGVRKMEWVSGNKRILDVFIKPEEETEDKAIYDYLGVPLIVHIYEDSPYITATDSKLYRHEIFNFPNPYSEFEKHYVKEN